VLEIEALTKRYPDGTMALDGVDLFVPSGGAVVLLGSNGSGKSTLLRCSMRLLEPTSGAVRIGDIDVTTADARELRAVRRGVGVVFQHINLVEHVSVLSNVLHGQLGRDASPRQWFAISASRDSRAHAMHCLERAGVADFAARRADQLSGGQRQRVALARMLMQQPTMVLADEPVAALDPRAGREVMDLLWTIVEEDGLTLVCALHQLQLARAYGQRIVGLRAGRKIRDCPTDALTEADISALYDRNTADGDTDSDDDHLSGKSRPRDPGEGPVDAVVNPARRTVPGGGR
jgi:phosphonate transport system ATP-binding protein